MIFHSYVELLGFMFRRYFWAKNHCISWYEAGKCPFQRSCTEYCSSADLCHWKMVWPVRLACMPRCESLFSKTIIGVRKECRLKANSVVELLVLWFFSIYIHLHNQLSQCIQSAQMASPFVGWLRCSPKRPLGQSHQWRGIHTGDDH